MNTETAARPRPLRLTQARIGDTLHDGNGTRVAIVNAFTTVNPETAAAGEALHDRWEADDQRHQFRTGLADALLKFCRGLFTTTNLIYLSWQIPLLRERLIVLLSGGYDRVDKEVLVAAAAARPEVAG